VSSGDLAIGDNELNLALLEEYPVWGSFEEDDSEVIRPVGEINPFSADCDPLTIRAGFVTTNEKELEGCVVIDRALECIFLVEIYTNDQCFGFNRELEDLAYSQLKALQESIGEDGVFPIRYRTSYKWPNGASLEGLFTPFR